jgi:hypothetical protein
MREISSTHRILHSLPKNQCKGGRCCRLAGAVPGCRHHRCRHVATWTCRPPHWRQGPLGVTALAGDVSTATCRHWPRRQGLAGTGPGGTCHVSPGQGCRHSQVVFFDKFFQRWSFLPFHWCRWSDMSKIPVSSGHWEVIKTERYLNL